MTTAKSLLKFNIRSFFYLIDNFAYWNLIQINPLYTSEQCARACVRACVCVCGVRVRACVRACVCVCVNYVSD